MIELAAKAKFPGGIDLVEMRDPVAAFQKTRDVIAQSSEAVVFEAAVLSGLFQARIDILRRQGDTLELIEVKSSALNGDGEQDDSKSPFLNGNGEVVGKWREYLLDEKLTGSFSQSVT